MGLRRAKMAASGDRAAFLHASRCVADLDQSIHQKIMKISKLLPGSVLFLALAFDGLAQAQTNANDYYQAAQRVASQLKYQSGTIQLQGGLATLNVPPTFQFLDGDDAEKVLVGLWGNPPSSVKPLGMLLPAGTTPLSTNCWAVTVDYAADGYVKDDDAARINYDDLLKQMQKAVEEANKERQAKGYPTAELLGWAAPPHYDPQTHKLYWAKKYRFTGQDMDTLNYNIRILGRRGVLELNAIAGMNQWDVINEQMPQVLGMVNFDQGNRYADFDPSVDKVAKYGLAALVAGGTLAVAAKLGFLKLIWVAILAAKKFILVAFASLLAIFKKWFKPKSSSSSSSPYK